MESEYRNTCSDCEEKGNNTFARLFYKKIKDEWKWFCKKCWEKNV